MANVFSGTNFIKYIECLGDFYLQCIYSFNFYQLQFTNIFSRNSNLISIFLLLIFKFSNYISATKNVLKSHSYKNPLFLGLKFKYLNYAKYFIILISSFLTIVNFILYSIILTVLCTLDLIKSLMMGKEPWQATLEELQGYKLNIPG